MHALKSLSRWCAIVFVGLLGGTSGCAGSGGFSSGGTVAEPQRKSVDTSRSVQGSADLDKVDKGSSAGDSRATTADPRAAGGGDVVEPACDALAAGEVINFETLAGASDGLRISNQYKSSHGVSFALEGGGSPLLRVVNGSSLAWYCTSDDCSSRVNGVRPGESLGTYVLTSNEEFGADAIPLLIDYDQPVDAATGVIIDVDSSETWIVEAFDAAGSRLDNVKLAPKGSDGNDYDGRAMRFIIRRDGKRDIRRLRLIGSKAKGRIGLAFDNFSPAKACR